MRSIRAFERCRTVPPNISLQRTRSRVRYVLINFLCHPPIEVFRKFSSMTYRSEVARAEGVGRPYGAPAAVSRTCHCNGAWPRSTVSGCYWFAGGPPRYAPS